MFRQFATHWITGDIPPTRLTTATCGSGCRGSWSMSMPYRLGRSRRGTVQVYEVSARDGTRQHVVNVPVVLTAAP